ncbi:MAG: hypothetical protein L6W00_11455 [Lentisphaeria bacterium]|nr:MAG: hypothetical protein L6W00_11455 [Lentisphaeria bacterium]
MQRLGFNTLWSQPANTGPTYMPVDYQKLCADFGTPEEYAAMCNEAAKRGIRLLQDIVPHGGTVESARERGNSVFALRFLENGGVLPPGRVNALAFNSKEWQRYVADSARMFTRLGAAGFRIDQCGGSGPDWRRTDWPPRDPDTPPAGTDPEWWKKSLPQDRLSPPPFRASLSTRQGGYELIQAVRGAAREVRQDAAVLAEVPDAVHVRSGDFIYDFMGRVWLHKFFEPSGGGVRPRLHPAAGGAVLHRSGRSHPHALRRAARRPLLGRRRRTRPGARIDRAALLRARHSAGGGHHRQLRPRQRSVSGATEPAPRRKRPAPPRRAELPRHPDRRPGGLRRAPQNRCRTGGRADQFHQFAPDHTGGLPGKCAVRCRDRRTGRRNTPARTVAGAALHQPRSGEEEGGKTGRRPGSD